MRLDKSRIRTLTRNDAGQHITQPTGAVVSSSYSKYQKSEESTIGVMIPKTQLPEVEADETGNPADVDLTMQLANEGLGGARTSNQGPRNIYAPILEGFLSEGETSDQTARGESTGNKVAINDIYRDIYASDPISGNAVDLMSNMPFGDFTLAGAREAKFLEPFEVSIDNMHVQSLMPALSAEYLVYGLFVATEIYNESDKVFTGIIPQNVDYVDVTPIPMWGADPLITLQIGDAIKTLQKSNDPRAQEYLNALPEGYANGDKGGFKPKPEDVLFIPRSNLIRDVRGVSLYRRLLTMWILEKALFRGTIDQAFKRQRAIAHVVIGNDEWQATQQEMQSIASMLMRADLDPTGAVMVTRDGVNVNEIRPGDALWKVTDLESNFTTAKLRALGISEAFLSGEASFNAMDQVLSVYVEQMRAYRDKITWEVFYERMFPRLARDNNLTNKKAGLQDVTASDNSQGDLFPSSLLHIQNGMPYIDTASDQYIPRMKRVNKDLLIPKVLWHKRLRPEADAQYLEMLQTLTQIGLPIPLRMWAAAGGLDLKSLLNQQEEDVAIRDSLKDWLKTIGKTSGAGLEGGLMGGDGGEALAMLTASTFKKKGLMSRNNDGQHELYGARNIGGDGKRHLLSAKGARMMEENINRQLAATAASLGQQLNAMETRLEEKQRDFYGRKTFST